MGTMKPDFAGDVALVTGSAGGMGRAIVLAFAAAGATVVTADVDATGGQETERLAREAGGSADFIQTDISDPEAVEALVATAVDRHGGLRYAVNAAAIENETAPLHECDLDTFDRKPLLNQLAGQKLPTSFKEPILAMGEAGDTCLAQHRTIFPWRTRLAAKGD